MGFNSGFKGLTGLSPGQ